MRNMIDNDEIEAMAILSEEAAEVQKAISKILRFGFDSVYPEGAPDNMCKLISELGDLSAAIELARIVLDITDAELQEATDKKLLDYASGKYLTMSPPGWLEFHTAIPKEVFDEADGPGYFFAAGD
jgi:NTP pyrophosphatase (non-canonical NTP hydrolase)